GLSYGWNIANTGNTRDRDAANSPDQRFDTVTLTQKNGTFNWDLGVTNNPYSVKLVSGDPSFIDSHYKINIEGKQAFDFVPTSANRWIGSTTNVKVTDGKLSLTNPTGSSNNKVCFIEVQAEHPRQLLGEEFDRQT